MGVYSVVMTCDNCTNKNHPSHTDQMGKLNRASGQIDAVKRMIEDGRYCVDILTQIKAARSALKSIEISILQKHMESCLGDAAHKDEDAMQEKINEIVTLLKKYE